MSQRQSISRLTPYLFIAPAALVMALALFYPIAYMVWGSFLDWSPSQDILPIYAPTMDYLHENDFLSNEGYRPFWFLSSEGGLGSWRIFEASTVSDRSSQAEWVGLGNYAKLLVDPNFHESFWVTLVFAFTVVTVEMVLGVGLALLLDRNIRGMSVLRTLFILPMMIAPVVVGLVWRYMFHQTYGTFNRFLESIGLEGIDWLGQNPLLSVILADVWQWTPFIFILSLAALQSLPRSALEAARIDGANGWQQVLYIKLPLMMPVLIVTMLLRLIDAFKVLEVILVLTGGGPGQATEILALRISRTAREFRELGEAAAMSNYLLMLLMVLTLTMFAFTRWQEARAKRLRFAAQEEA